MLRQFHTDNEFSKCCLTTQASLRKLDIFYEFLPEHLKAIFLAIV